MKFTYSLALLMAIALLACSDEEKELLLFQESLISGDQVAMKNIAAHTESSIYSLMDLLQDDNKAKYRPIPAAIDSIHHLIEEIQSDLIRLSEELKTETDLVHIEEELASIPRNLLALNLDVLTYYERLLKEQRQDFQLTLEEIAGKTEFITTKLVIVDSLWPQSAIYLSDGQTRVLLTQTILDLERVKNVITEDLVTLSGGKMIHCFFFFIPTVIPLKEEIEKGEAFEALIFGFEDLIHGSNSLLKLSVGGKALPIINGKYAYYKSAPLERSTTITINATAVNELTGESLSFMRDFGYKIVVH